MLGGSEAVRLFSWLCLGQDTLLQFQSNIFTKSWHSESLRICLLILCCKLEAYSGFPGGPLVKRTHLPVQETSETQTGSLGREDPLEEGMATHSSILAWRITWTEEAGGLQSRGSQRVGHN